MGDLAARSRMGPMAQRFEPVLRALNEAGVRYLVDTTATVVSLEDLLALKREAGRPRDLEDVDVLEAIQRRRDDE